MNRISLRWTLPLLGFLLICAGCTNKADLDNTPGASANSQSDAEESAVGEDETSSPLSDETATIEPLGPIEINADQLLSGTLSADQLSKGWIRLFDRQSLFGWFVVGNANWSIDDGVIKVDRGERSYLCTSFQLSDYELQVDFRSDSSTNSGVFLRTGPQPEDVSQACLELNIAPPDNPFPTGSFVQRKKLEPDDLPDFDPTVWHTYRVRLIGRKVEVFLDDEKIMELDNFDSSPSGHISLQHNEGLVEFRNVLLRPVNAQPLKLDETWEQEWTKTVADDAQLEVEAVADGLKLKGGLGQLQSKESFADFFLQARYTLASPEVNSGIFFRCVPDAMLDGYECQLNHAVADGDPLRPLDAGAGAIFRRQPARIVVGDGTTPTYVTVLANGAHILTWINGLQIADFFDERKPDENPRRGLRLEAGPISLQAHDSETEVTFHDIRVSPL